MKAAQPQFSRINFPREFFWIAIDRPLSLQDISVRSEMIRCSSFTAHLRSSLIVLVSLVQRSGNQASSEPFPISLDAMISAGESSSQPLWDVGNANNRVSSLVAAPKYNKKNCFNFIIISISYPEILYKISPSSESKQNSLLLLCLRDGCEMETISSTRKRASSIAKKTRKRENMKYSWLRGCFNIFIFVLLILYIADRFSILFYSSIRASSLWTSNRYERLTDVHRFLWLSLKTRDFSPRSIRGRKRRFCVCSSQISFCPRIDFLSSLISPSHTLSLIPPKYSWQTRLCCPLYTWTETVCWLNEVLLSQLSFYSNSLC